MLSTATTLSERKKLIYGTGLLFCMLILAWVKVNRLAYSTLMTQARENMAISLVPYSQSLTANVQSKLALLDGLQAFAELELPVDSRFGSFAHSLASRVTAVSYVSLAPDGIQKYVYPLKGNEAVVGHNLIRDERTHVRINVQNALETEKVVLSGPHALRQGDTGLLAKRAVYKNGQVWGLATMAIDLSQLFGEVLPEPFSSGLQIAVRDDRQQVFYGEERVFANNPVIFGVTLPDGKWEMAAIPLHGWHAAVRDDFIFIQFAGLLFVLLISFGGFMALSRDAHLNHAVKKATFALSMELMERKQIMQNLHESEEKYRLLFYSNPHPMWVYDKETLQFLAVNNAAAVKYGYTLAEFLSMTIKDIRPPEDVPRLLDAIKNISGVIQEAGVWRHIKKDGSILLVEIISHNLKFDGRGAAVVLAHDVTDRVQSEAKIKELYRKQEETNKEILSAYNATIEGWSRALELRDKETEGHSQRVTEMTVELARRMGLNAQKIAHIRRGALLHDIGKMGVPDAILLKPGSLTDDESAVMRKHTTYAIEMLAHIDYLKPALAIPYSHHEKWDGTGYPQGIKGEKIPLEARIFAVVDVFDALTNDRPYRKAWPPGKAIAYIQEHSGTHFDPRVVAAFNSLSFDR